MLRSGIIREEKFPGVNYPLMRGEKKVRVSFPLTTNYLDLVASAVILQNKVDMTGVIRYLSAEGFKINRRMLATMSLYLNCNLKRYGDYVVDLKNIPQPFDGAINLPVEIFESHTE
ncbi:MAG: Tn3 family transposase [Cyanobacteria bacterium P01_G01_bin.39]